MSGANRVYLIDGDGKIFGVAVDEISGAMEFISTFHHEIHAAKTFSAYRNGTKNADGQIRLLIIPSSGYYGHLLFPHITGTAAGNFVLYENTSYSAPGSGTVAPMQENRNFRSRVSQMTLQDSFTIQDTGTQILKRSFGAGQREGDTSRVSEVVLRDDEAYLMILQSDGSSNEMLFEALWYEETSKGS